MLCACDTQSSVASICSLAPASLKLAARQSSPPALNNPECSGPYEAPTRFSLFGVAVSTAALKIIGKRAAPPDFHFYVVHPCGTGGDDGDSRESLRIIFPAGSRSFSGWPTNKELPGNNRGFVSVMHWQSAVWSSGHPSATGSSLYPEARL